MVKNAFLRPTEKACWTPAWADSRTASRLGSNPNDPMVAVTIAVAIAKLMMFDPFRTRLSRADTMPYRSNSTALRTELELGE